MQYPYQCLHEKQLGIIMMKATKEITIRALFGLGQVIRSSAKGYPKIAGIAKSK